MAIESVATHPESYHAEPVHGNFTGDAAMHLWCADALAAVLAAPNEPVDSLNDELQEALRYLLHCEIRRARQAEAAGSKPAS